MPEPELPQLTITTTVFFKGRNGEIKELQVVQPMDPSQQKMNFADIQLLAKEISKVMKEEE
jgi:hypothetical protein